MISLKEKKEIFTAVMSRRDKRIDELAEAIQQKYEVTMIKKPQRGLVMYRGAESVQEMPFNAGEVLVTTAEAMINDVIGYAMVMGMDELQAHNASVVMAALEAGVPEREEVRLLADKLKHEKQTKMLKEREIINSTRVNFEVMGGQDPNVSHNKEREE